MMRIGSAALVLTALVGCVSANPEFPEPSWGDSPPPGTEEVVEITLKKVVCIARAGCTAVTTILHSGGGASQEFTTGDTHDSTLVSSIDSSEFAHLALRMVNAGFFGPDGSLTCHQDWGSSETWVISGAARGLRKVERHPCPRVRHVLGLTGGRWSSVASRANLLSATDSLIRSLRWVVPK